MHSPTGKLAAYIVSVLLGKHKPTYHPMSDLGDHVVVVNCKDVGILGERQWEHKIYRHHTGFPGGFREMKARDVWRQVSWLLISLVPWLECITLSVKKNSAESD